MLWWSPDPRAVIFPDQLHISKSLRKVLRQGRYQVTTDKVFSTVVQHCAQPRAVNGGTWITPAMVAAYTLLHKQGHAHSVECWINGGLVGGLYGVSVGRIFCGESMFSLQANGSKIALAHLAQGLCRSGYTMIDCQVGNDHLDAMGAVALTREAFLDRLHSGSAHSPDWPAAEISDKVNFSCLAR